jgi:hypothetical protein
MLSGSAAMEDAPTVPRLLHNQAGTGLQNHVHSTQKCTIVIFDDGVAMHAASF